MAIVHNSLGILLQNMGDLPGAEQEFRTALKIWQGVFHGNEHVVIASSHANLGNLMGALGRAEEAWRYLQLGLEGFDETFGSSHPSVARVNIDLASERVGREAMRPPARS